MTSTKDVFSFKNALATLPRGMPLGTATLQAHGASAFRASALARSRCLIHLARGVYMLAGRHADARRVPGISRVRLAELLASDLDLPWAPLAKRPSRRVGGRKRWVAVTESGERLDLKRS